MNPELVARALQGILSPHEQERTEAQKVLETVDKQHVEGYGASLINLVSRPDVPQNIRMGAIVRLRRLVMKKWTIGTPKNKTLNLIHTADRAAIRDNLIPCTIREENEPIRKMLSDCIFHVARTDFPEKWGADAVNPIYSTLQTQLQANISSPTQVIGALSCYYALLKVRRNNSQSSPVERGFQNELVSSGMVFVLPLVQMLLQQEDSVMATKNVESIMFVFTATHLVAKILSGCFKQFTLDYFKQPANVNTVTQILFQLARTSHNDYCDALWVHFNEKAYRNPLFKRRKWAARVLNRLTRGLLKVTEQNNRSLAEEQIKWNRAWIKAFSGPALDIILQSLYELPAHPNSSGAQFIFPMLRIVHYHVQQRKSPLFQNKIVPTIDSLLQTLPTILMLNEVDLETIDDQPTFFIDRILCAGMGNQFGQDRQSECYELIRTLFTTQPSLVPKALSNLIEKPLNDWNSFKQRALNGMAHTEAEYNAMLLRKDVSCAMFGGLTRNFDAPGFIEHTLNYLQHYVDEHLSAPFDKWSETPLLEIRTIWLIGLYSKVLLNLVQPTSSNKDGGQQAPYPSAVERVMPLVMRSAEVCMKLLVPETQHNGALLRLPHFQAARIQATSTLEKLLKFGAVKEAVKPFAPQLFMHVMTMIEEHDNETISVLFQNLLLLFRRELEPISEEVIKRLVPKFLTLVKEIGNFDADADDNATGFDDDDDDDDDDDKFWAAQAHLNSMYTIVAAIQNNADALTRVQSHLLPLCGYIIDNGLMDYTEEVAQMLRALTYYSDDLSPELWSLYPKLIGMVLNGDAVEEFDSLILPLANYLAKPYQSLYSIQVDFKETNGAVTKVTCLELFYRMVFHYYDIKDASSSYDISRLQEGCTHLLRTQLGWMPSEQELPAEIITKTLQVLVPALFNQIIRSIYPYTTDAMNNPNLNFAQRKEFEAQDQKEKREKYCLLLIDCIWILVYKFPSYFIPQLLNAQLQIPVVEIASPQTTTFGNVMSSLEVLLEFCNMVYSRATRTQSLAYNIIGLGTLLKWISSPPAAFANGEFDNNTAMMSTYRGNMAGLLLRLVNRFEEAEQELLADDDADDDDQDYRCLSDDDDDDAALLFGGDQEANTGQQPTDEDAAIQRELQRQNNQFEAFRSMAQTHAEESHDAYFQDHDFTTPLDGVNHFAFFMEVLHDWVGHQQQTVTAAGGVNVVLQQIKTHAENEIGLINSIATSSEPAIQHILKYTTDSSLQWQKEREEGDEDEEGQ